jgi:uncharacterized protein
MLKPEELPHYRSAAEAAAVIPQGDVVLLTGSTLLTDTLDDLLRLCRPDARVVVVGPTAGLLPEPLLRRGVDLIGGIRAPGTFLHVLAEGGSGAHVFGRSAERVVLARRAPKPPDATLPRPIPGFTLRGSHAPRSSTTCALASDRPDRGIYLSAN